MDYKFSTSLMCMDFSKLKYEIEVLNECSDFMHIDIMDGHYVNNFALSPVFMEKVKGLVKIPMDAHLMIEEPSIFLEDLAKAGASFISPHAETINKNAFRTIYRIKELGCRVGVVLNPATSLEDIKYYAHLLDKITIMTVDAGFAAQRFVPEVLEKIAKAKKWKEEYGYNYLIEVDGSCNESTYKVLTKAGAEVFVVGSTGLFGLDTDIKIAWNKMMLNFNREVK